MSLCINLPLQTTEKKMKKRENEPTLLIRSSSATNKWSNKLAWNSRFLLLLLPTVLADSWVGALSITLPSDALHRLSLSVNCRRLCQCLYVCLCVGNLSLHWSPGKRLWPSNGHFINSWSLQSFSLLFLSISASDIQCQSQTSWAPTLVQCTRPIANGSVMRWVIAFVYQHQHWAHQLALPGECNCFICHRNSWWD